MTIYDRKLKFANFIRRVINIYKVFLVNNTIAKLGRKWERAKKLEAYIYIIYR